MNAEQIQGIIIECLDALNTERPHDKKLQISSETELLAENSQLDSLDFVALSVDLEERLRRMTGRTLELSPGAVAENEHPLRTVTSMASYIEKKLAAAA